MTMNRVATATMHPKADAPMATFDAALTSGDVPAFNIVLPDGCEDGEENCKPINGRVGGGASFQVFLPWNPDIRTRVAPSAQLGFMEVHRLGPIAPLTAQLRRSPFDERAHEPGVEARFRLNPRAEPSQARADLTEPSGVA